MKFSVQSIKIIVCFCSILLTISICTSCTPSSSTTDSLPHSIKRDYVIVQDYANNETSLEVINLLADAINEEISNHDSAKKRLDEFGQDQFMINAAVPFEDGVLICGDTVRDGENYCNLYYFENGQIIYRTFDSDCWSLNYTVFKDHTIAYGKSIGWDNGVIMQDKVVAQFANGETSSHVFSNIPFKSEKEGWHDEEVITDGYILIADGQTWIENIEFYGKDGSVQNDWRSDLFVFDERDLWKGKSNKIWNAYCFTNMYTDEERAILYNQNPLYIIVNDVHIYFKTSLLSKEIGMEYIWRNNSYYLTSEIKDINDASEIEIIGLRDDYEVIWLNIDKDDGSHIADLNEIRLNEPPSQKGNYCLIVKHNYNQVFKDGELYFSMLVKIV